MQPSTPPRENPTKNASRTRREFLAKAALLSGGFMTFGMPFISAPLRSAIAAPLQRDTQVMSTRYALDLNGTLAGPLKSVDSGFISGQFTKAMGPMQQFKKHLATIVYEDITIQCGTDMAPSFYQWVQSALDGQPAQMNGAILTTNAMNQVIDRKEFQNALITEVVFPAMNTSSNSPVFMNLTIKPGQTILQPGTGAQVSFPLQQHKSKAWLASNFRLQIQGLEQACAHVIAIDALDWKQPVNQMPTGFRETSQGPVGPFDAPNLVITLPQAQAEPFAQWFRDFVVQGQASDNDERPGILEYLEADRQTPIMTLSFGHLGIFRMAPVPQTDTKMVPLVKIEMYCESLQLTQSPGGGSGATQSSTSSTQPQQPPPRPKFLRPQGKNITPRLPLQK